MANHNLPTLTSTYSNFVSELDGRLDDLALGLDPANTTATNVPTGAIRWSSAASTWQRWNGTAWVALSASYAINLAGPATVVANSTGDALRITQTGSGNAFVVEDSTSPDATPFVIDANGRALVGLTSALPIPLGNPLQVSQSAASGIALARFTADITDPDLRFAKSRNTTNGTPGAVVLQNDRLGSLRFYGDDGAAFVQASNIESYVDGTPGTNDMPGRLVFSTTRDGASSPTEAMRIDSNQSVRITNGTASDALRITQTGAGNCLVVEDSTSPDATPFVIDASGNIVSGSTTPYPSPINSSFVNRLQLHSISQYGATIDAVSWQAGTDVGANLVLARSDSGTVGAHTLIGSTDVIGNIRFYGSDGTKFVDGARISAVADGTPGTDSMPGRLTFSTTPTGSSTPVERTRIDSAGRLRQLGTTIVSNVNMLGASYDSVSFSVAAEETGPSALFFSPDGRKMFVMGSTGDDVNEYTLSTPWVVSSATYVTVFSVSGQDTNPTALFFRADGLKMYMVGQASDAVFQYALTTPWSIATASYESKSFSVATEEATPTGLFFKPDGLSMYVVGSTSDSVHQYALTTAWEVNTASFVRSFSVAGQETLPTELSFTGDGTRMFVLGSSGDDVTVYNLTTPWDISTASHIGQFSVSGQDATPQGLYVKPDGTKMYMVGSTSDTVYQYTVPSVEIQLTGTTAINGTATVAQDLIVEGGLTVECPQTPASASATGTAGQIAWDANYIYVCVATNTWRRAALSSW